MELAVDAVLGIGALALRPRLLHTTHARNWPLAGRGAVPARPPRVYVNFALSVYLKYFCTFRLPQICLPRSPNRWFHNVHITVDTAAQLKGQVQPSLLLQVNACRHTLPAVLTPQPNSVFGRSGIQPPTDSARPQRRNLSAI